MAYIRGGCKSVETAGSQRGIERGSVTLSQMQPDSTVGNMGCREDEVNPLNLHLA
jgi:hypothetical protein